MSVCALALLAFVSTKWSAVPQAIPFELTNGHVFVQAFVNGRGPYRFALDTGASGMGRADTRLRHEASLPKIDEAANSDGIKVTTSDVVMANVLRVGDVERRKVELLSRDYNKNLKPGEQPLMGIIGRDFFADRLLTIDYPARRIRFSGGGLKAKQAGVVPYGPSLTIPVCFRAGCFPGKVDTGSSRGLVIPKELVGKVDATAPVLVGQAMRTNSTATLYGMTLREPVRISAVISGNQKALYAEPSDSVINIGSDFLKDYVLTIDQRHKLLSISKPRSH